MLGYTFVLRYIKVNGNGGRLFSRWHPCSPPTFPQSHLWRSLAQTTVLQPVQNRPLVIALISKKFVAKADSFTLKTGRSHCDRWTGSQRATRKWQWGHGSSRPMDYPGTESILCYCKGGFHPVHLGDIFHDRYLVINKLGYGAYGTVWLAEDLSLKRFAALKVLSASASSSSELDVVLHLMNQQESNPLSEGAKYIVRFLDTFDVEGPNGTHHCIVTELLGPSLGCHEIEDIHDDGPPSPAYTKRIVAQIARGVAYLHKCGVVHGGTFISQFSIVLPNITVFFSDLHTGNILLCNPAMEQWSLQDFEYYYGKPHKLPPSPDSDSDILASSPIGLPQYLIPTPEPTPLLELCLSSSESVHVKICDFSESFLTTTHTKTHLHIPTIYAAPEILFPEPPTPIGPPTDMWALAVLMHMVLSYNSTLFSSYDGIAKEVIREMVLAIGKLPSKWWNRWLERSEYFTEDGAFIGDKELSSLASGEFLKVHSMSEEELEALESLIRKMVCYEAKDRISAEEVVRLIPAQWMNGL
ncbi:kinase-like domain-containing protein [Gymnopilus junonius]|uniref:non-specific serine/threonine protein kinase n=1 Tax=Gymnopilus junonius TaxID=109634 RepID=A0A9P5NPU5_GYMJU|nr:kinase-like domain-containing protein [Gymnopilus junonius]